MPHDSPMTTEPEPPRERPAGPAPSRQRVNRRRFLLTTAGTGAAAAAAACSTGGREQATPSEPGPGAPAAEHGGPVRPGHDVAGSSMGHGGALPVVAGYTYFTPFQVAIVGAAAARIIPTDENGPGATEAGVVGFIDRQLASDYGLAGRRYDLGPFAKGAPTQGDQSGLSTRDRYRLGINGMDAYARRLYGAGFAAVGPAEQDRILTDIEAGRADGFDGVDPRAFFELLRYHTVAGFFADPVRGGNRDLVGWKLIGFPGAQVSYTAWITRYGVPFDGPYRSLGEHHAEFGGHQESRP